ncbi:MAG TPA: hypothetical protein VGV37_03235 [Aliidongia sp.]|uniref:hypothetical protein n=1 Tax=Aliidongia sp. TaxID=1914230 RepID=UPI002DDD3D3E|nr:hypothetical protein [Aliidongia sp.]HEV2673528.1 hypothetical protein [Aliidongia sp.]
MSISSVGQGPVSTINTNGQVQGRQQQLQATDNNNQSNKSAKPTGVQPLNSSGRGQVVNLVV